MPVDWPVNDCDEHVVRERLEMSDRISDDRLLLRNARRQERQSRRERQRRQKLFLSIFLLKFLKQQDKFHSDLKQNCNFLLIHFTFVEKHILKLAMIRIYSLWFWLKIVCTLIKVDIKCQDTTSNDFLRSDYLPKPVRRRWPLSSCSSWEEFVAMFDWLKNRWRKFETKQQQRI